MVDVKPDSNIDDLFSSGPQTTDDEAADGGGLKKKSQISTDSDKTDKSARHRLNSGQYL